MTGAGPARGPGGVPLLEAGLAIEELDLHGGPHFWREVESFAAQAALEGWVERLLAEPRAPRIWTFLDLPEATATRIVAALCAARALAHRGQTVVVIDGDDQRPDLTRWAGRHEREGWIDFIRYGASLPTCSAALPWGDPPGRLLGIGSFAPTLVSAYEAEWLLALLSGQADFILVAAPLGQTGRPWSAAASLRLLCWNRAAVAEEELTSRLDAAGSPPDAVIAFGSTELLLLTPPAPAELEPAVAVARPLAAAPAGAAPPAREHGAPPTLEPDLPLGGAPAVAMAAAAPPPAAARTRSSRLFVALAAALTVAVVGVGAWWLRVALEPRPGGEVSTLAPPRPAGDISPPPAAQEEAHAQRLAAADSAPRGPAATAPAPAETAQPAPAAAGESEPPVERTSMPVATAPAPPASPSAGEALAAEPFRMPVGQAGWALHVFSLADSVQANSQIAELRRQGLRAEWRAVHLPEKGRWYRVYTGSFPTQEAALAARPALLARLRTDWAQPVRY